MTQIFDFAPTTFGQPFSFTPILDGSPYNASVPSLVFGNRFYLSLFALDGTQILLTALVGSPPGVQLQSLSWANGIVTATTAIPHGYRVGSTVALTLVGSTPGGYNGQFQCLITGPLTFSYPLATNPGNATVFGSTNFNVNLIGGVAKQDGTFFASMLVYRSANRQFEISP